jgi:hypothetical protein
MEWHNATRKLKLVNNKTHSKIHMKTTHTRKPSETAADFLEALLFAQPPNEDGEYIMDGKTAYDFSPAFVEGVESFIAGFLDYTAEKDLDIPEAGRSFGGNVFFSLSGLGCGFWDDSETEHLQEHLEAYSGNKYRFEQIDLMEDENGKLDLSILAYMREEYRNRLFSTND